MNEFQAQKYVFEWAKVQRFKYPELGLMFAIPNGQMRKGQRPEPGIKSGVPDIFLPVTRENYHGLFIEMKREKTSTNAKGALRIEQKDWLYRLGKQGYATAVCYGFDDAIKTLTEYLKIENNGRKK